MPLPASRFGRVALLSALTVAGCATPRAAPPVVADAPVAATPPVHLFFRLNERPRYVESGFRVPNDAYVLIVAVDLDRQIRVLYPESPRQGALAARHGSTYMPSLFVGYPSGGYEVTQRLTPYSGGGVLMAVASERPLRLERLADEQGDWDGDRLAQLVFERTVSSAANSVASAVVLEGQDYSTDYISIVRRSVDNPARNPYYSVLFRD